MEKYNGWTNYETFQTVLWLETDGSIEAIQEKMADDDKNGIERISEYELGLYIKESILDDFQEFVESSEPKIRPMYVDMVHGTLAQVNWQEIAKSILEEVSV